ncbi:MAG: hypothetical protein JNN15_08905, partial [Blastocatellia bacterium]|nr:hypothetical protein [Blastocatellia bacterium]
VKLELLDYEGQLISIEHTVTDLVMRNGARVFCVNQVPIGEFLILKTADEQFESPAIVKDAVVGDDNIPRIILEFTGNDWQNKWLFPEDTVEEPFIQLPESEPDLVSRVDEVSEFTEVSELIEPETSRLEPPLETKREHYSSLLQLSQDASMLLQIIIADIGSGQYPDKVFLNELKGSVDQLRSLLYQIQKSYYRH